jgi:elongation factor P
MDTSQFRNGSKIELGGEPFVITYFQHVKPGKGGAFVRTKLRNLKTGRVLERTFRAGEKVEAADVEERKMQYLYADGDSLVFMDCQSFDQIPITGEQVGDTRRYLLENMEVQVLIHKGSAINIELPAFVQLTVTRCDPGLRGDTASGGTKPVTVETGAVVQAPLFIKEGETIRIDTRTGEYVERVNT